MSFRKNLIDNIIVPESLSKLSNAQGTIVSYNQLHHRADVFMATLKGGTGGILYDVPVQISGNGLHTASLKEHDQVYVQFNNSSLFQAKIIGKSDELYATHTREKEKHLRKGSLIASQVEESGDVNPSSSTWTDGENENYFKHMEYKDISAIDNISRIKMEKGRFKNEEVGLFNPNSSSIVKILDDGTIDIFAGTNIGIRINPRTRTLEFSGSCSTKSDNWSVLSNNVEVISTGDLTLTADTINLNAKKIKKNGEDYA